MKNIINEKPSLNLSGLSQLNVRSIDDNDMRGRRILDIGCGYGWFEMHALKMQAEEITGTELSEKDLVTAKKHVKDSRIHFTVGSAIDLPFEKERFHTVVAWEVLEHLPKGTESMLFDEVYRVLKPGGVFYLSTPQTSFLSNCLDPAWWLIGHRHYGKRELQALALSLGFTIERTYSHGRYWMLLSFLNLYIAKWIFRRRPFLDSFIQRKVVEESSRNDGFVDLFLKCRKPA